MKSAIVIIPTTGSPDVRTAIQSCLALDYPGVRVLAVIDGSEHQDAFNRTTYGLDRDRISSVTLATGVGSKGFYGHRIYAAFSHLVNEDYVLFLDEDNFYEREHLSRMVEKLERKQHDWIYSLRRVCDESGNYLFNDDCESLGWWQSVDGYRLIDTSCYCLRREVAIKVSSVWHGGWGRDRMVTAWLIKQQPQFSCSNAYTLNYRLHEPKPPTRAFFQRGNAATSARYPNGFPWAEPS